MACVKFRNRSMRGFVSLRALDVSLRRDWRAWRVDIVSGLSLEGVAHENVYSVTLFRVVF